jgi:hypothetical protein
MLRLLFILCLLYSCKTGPNYGVRVTPGTVAQRQKVVNKQTKRMQRKMNKARKNYGNKNH